ncbi:hypothetical protein HDU76_004673 [Blyttiomyces sp. JEL0837]|nr:hypothetical protein HDU76_004673 [Blyttiomyces sp. JEL0837]
MEIKHSFQVRLEFKNVEKPIIHECYCTLTSVGRADCEVLLDDYPELMPSLDYDKLFGNDVWLPQYTPEDPWKWEMEKGNGGSMGSLAQAAEEASLQSGNNCDVISLETSNEPTYLENMPDQYSSTSHMQFDSSAVNISGHQTGNHDSMLYTPPVSPTVSDTEDDIPLAMSLPRQNSGFLHPQDSAMSLSRATSNPELGRPHSPPESPRTSTDRPQSDLGMRIGTLSAPQELVLRIFDHETPAEVEREVQEAIGIALSESVREIVPSWEGPPQYHMG